MQVCTFFLKTEYWVSFMTSLICKYTIYVKYNQCKNNTLNGFNLANIIEYVITLNLQL